MKNGRGFTLIELLVVISIIALLSSVVLSSLNTARSKGRDVRRMADMRQLRNAVELYFSQNGQYPSCSGTNGVGFTCAMNALGAGGFISSTSTINDPQYPSKWYEYDNYCAVPGPGSLTSQFRFWAVSENSQPNANLFWWSNFYIGATNCSDAS